MLSFIGIIISLLSLIYLSYKGFNVLITAPLLALLACSLSFGISFLAVYTQIFMPALGNFIIQYFPIFILGAIFGKLMDDSGSAEVIASKMVDILGNDRAILSIIISCAILTYGGVSLFVVAFAVYPIANSLFIKSNIPKRLIPASIALGAFTFTMTSMPGTTSIQNSIPMPYFGTNSFSAPIIGVIASVIMFSCGYFWLQRQRFQAIVNKENYSSNEMKNKNIEDINKMRMISQEQGFDIAEINFSKIFDSNNSPNFIISILPIILVVLLNYIFTHVIFQNIKFDSLAEKFYGAIDLSSVIGIWSIISSLFISSIFLIITKRKYFKNLKYSLDSGATASVLPIFNTASLVGFGKVISSLEGFDLIKSYMNHLSFGNPLVSIAISVNILAGITGSASGGMSIALQNLAHEYILKAEESGINHDLLHRIVTIATGGLDSLPHNGAVVTLLAICNLTHKEAYKDIFIVAVIFPIFSLIIVTIIGSYFGSF